jgi:DNA adenine methylase
MVQGQVAIIQSSDDMVVAPFLKWAGGKRWLLARIKDLIPNFKRYFEPFLGGGAVFFSLINRYKDEAYFLSDINKPLIDTYTQLRTNAKDVVQHLNAFRNSRTTYYRIRAQVQNDPVYEAARFIYLNKTCFNGLYRVNKSGIFNVPYGRNVNKDYFDEEFLIKVGATLREVRIEARDFEISLADTKEGDFVFLDPPYTVAHKNNGFVEYNEKIFSWDDQKRLAKCVKRLAENNVKFILTNAAHSNISELYSGIADKIEIERVSTMSGSISARRKVSEYVYTNCIGA